MTLEKGLLKKAAFELHQTAEALYTAIELVFTNYKPKSHDLEDWSHKAGVRVHFTIVGKKAALRYTR